MPLEILKYHITRDVAAGYLDMEVTTGDALSAADRVLHFVTAKQSILAFFINP